MENSKMELFVDVLEDKDFDGGWFEIKDPVVRNMLLNTLLDKVNRKVLELCTSMPRTIMDIMRNSGEPQTTVYRRINDLIEYQFIVYYDSIRTNRGYVLPRFITTIKRFKIEISDFNDVKLRIFPNPGTYNKMIFDSINA